MGAGEQETLPMIDFNFLFDSQPGNVNYQDFLKKHCNYMTPEILSKVLLRTVWKWGNVENMKGYFIIHGE